MGIGSRLAVTAVIVAALPVSAPVAGAAVKNGRYKGTDISFRVKKNRISNLKIVNTHSCQALGSPGLPDGEVRQITVPGTFKLSKRGTFNTSRHIGDYGEIQDISMGWRGRIRGGRAKMAVSTQYSYTKYVVPEGRFSIVRCFGNVNLKAKRQ
ncbi:MAG TPA: hypothetical protein VEX39_15070 [Thermoleophilaceae bacterium]|nr:hypothetical protein [Thermoleophilaceae bacterium]